MAHRPPTGEHVKITGIETVLFEPTWDDPHAGRFRRTHAAVRVRTDDGLTGNSRTSGQGAKLVADYLAPALAGEDPRNTERLWARMTRVAREAGVQATGVIGAVDIALWDLVGKAAGLPCWQLLGGSRDWVPAYADVPTRASSPAELGEQLAACVALGFDAVKFHVLNRDPDDAVRQTQAAREAVGPEVRLMIDLFGWFDARTAIDICRRIEPYDLFWVEEPALREDEPLGLAVVARHTRIPVAGAEGQRTLYGVRAVLEQGGLTYLQTDIVGGGGFTSFRKMAALAEAYHVQPRAARRLAAGPARPPGGGAAAHRHHPGDDAGPAAGALRPPVAGLRGPPGAGAAERSPGLGLEFDEAYLHRYRVG